MVQSSWIFNKTTRKENPMKSFIPLIAVFFLLTAAWPCPAQEKEPAVTAQPAQAAPDYMIGCSELCTNLPGGRAANVLTKRAFVINADGSGRRELAPQLITGPNMSTQLGGWSPDGRKAIIECKWESPENAAWEELNKSFRFETNGYLMDYWLLDMETGALTNVTAPERVSTVNAGVFFWPNEPDRLGLTAVIGSESKPFSMNLDGTNKRAISRDPGYMYGFNASPDGARVAYHRDYQLYLADADGSNPQHVETGNKFNFGPIWSPDGQWIMFVSGVRTNCDIYLVNRDGAGLRRLTDRGGYEGFTLFLDVPDYHEGSSDVPVWSPDGRWLYYMAKVGEAVELMRVSLEGQTEQFTHSVPGVTHYHPTFSPDGRWLAYGSKRDGVRQLYVCRPDGTNERQITQMAPGRAAMWPSWRPKPPAQPTSGR
jgi:TolB protein